MCIELKHTHIVNTNDGYHHFQNSKVAVINSVMVDDIEYYVFKLNEYGSVFIANSKQFTELPKKISTREQALSWAKLNDMRIVVYENNSGCKSVGFADEFTYDQCLDKYGVVMNTNNIGEPITIPLTEFKAV